MSDEFGYETGPYVNVATFCDQVVEGKDGVLTLVRVVDSLRIHSTGPEVPDVLPPTVAQTTLVIMLHAGSAHGPQSVQIVLETPELDRRPGPEITVQFPGGPGTGANLIVPFGIPVERGGLYWADVVVNDRVVARVPLTIDYEFTLADPA